MVTYKLEDLSFCQDFESLKQAMEGLFKLHYEEVACHKSVQTLSPNYDSYLNGILQGKIRVLTAREESEKVVGYCITLLQNSMHYKDIVYANNDVFYVCPEYRGKMTGVRLLDMALGDAKSQGASVYFMTAKSEHKFDKLLERKGFSGSEVIWSKEL